MTTLLRSLIDLAAAQADEHQLARAVHEALTGGTLTRRQLRARAEVVDPLAALRIERALTALERAWVLGDQGRDGDGDQASRCRTAHQGS